MVYDSTPNLAHAVTPEEKDLLETIQDHAFEKIVPTGEDVLFGRGRRTQKHLGNQRFRAIVDSYKERHSISTRAEKTRISHEIVNLIRCRGGRFLKQDPFTDKFFDVGDTVAREKASHALRSCKALAIKSSPRNRNVLKTKIKPQPDEINCDDLLRTQQMIFRQLVEDYEKGKKSSDNNYS